jgi:hypothetical protein
MSPILRLMHDLEESISAGSSERRETTLRRVTDLFLLDAELLTEEQIEIFDGVIARLAAAIEIRARVELARRLAPEAKAPPGIIRTLAHDEIEVARPVLVHSPRLDDAALVSVALAKGPAHQCAIAERPQLNEPVTEALVSHGAPPVMHVLAANRGARFSQESAAVLVDKARLDEELRVLLRGRSDLPEAQVQRLVGLAQADARRRLTDALPTTLRDAVEEALDRGARRVRAIVAGTLDYSAALDTVGAIEIGRPIDEEDIAGFAVADLLEETVCAVAASAGLSLKAAERLFTVADSDLLLVVAKAQGWSWGTLAELLRLRDPDALLPHHVKRLAETYEDLAPRTAQGVMRFIQQRDQSEAAGAYTFAKVR